MIEHHGSVEATDQLYACESPLRTAEGNHIPALLFRISLVLAAAATEHGVCDVVHSSVITQLREYCTH